MNNKGFCDKENVKLQVINSLVSQDVLRDAIERDPSVVDVLADAAETIARRILVKVARESAVDNIYPFPQLFEQ